MDNASRLKHGLVPYFLAFCLALALRFLHLDAMPLDDLEATWALQALETSQSLQPMVGPQPAYIAFTSATFFLFAPTNFLARFLPALAGSLVVLVVYLFRDRIEPLPGMMLAFFLALDPGLVALSRQAGSLMPALVFTLLAWGWWRQGRSRLAGVMAGLALLSGHDLWQGVLGLALAWAAGRLYGRRIARSAGSDGGEGTGLQVSGTFLIAARPALLFAGATLVLGGTLFFMIPSGLSAWVAALPEYLAGWFEPSGVPAGRLLLALIAYHPLALVFGVAGFVRACRHRDRLLVRLGLWLLVALSLALLYPSRQVGDLAWSVVPLWALASVELSRHARLEPGERREVSGVVLLVVLLLAFSWMDYAGIALDPRNPANLAPNGIQVGGTILFQNLPPTRYLLLVSVLLLLAISIALIAMGWSKRVAMLGLIWGLALSLGTYSLGVAWGATGLRTPGGWELWWPVGLPAQPDLLLTTVDTLSDWSAGDPHAQPVTILDLDSPALAWLLRERTVLPATALDVEHPPAIVISSRIESLELPTPYRGQDFIWRRAPAWETLRAYDWMHWSVFRELPGSPETIILWVREDVFPDARQSLP